MKLFITNHNYFQSVHILKVKETVILKVNETLI